MPEAAIGMFIIMLAPMCAFIGQEARWYVGVGAFVAFAVVFGLMTQIR